MGTDGLRQYLIQPINVEKLLLYPNIIDIVFKK